MMPTWASEASRERDFVIEECDTPTQFVFSTNPLFLRLAPQVEMNTRYSFKQATLAAVSGTPMHIVNNVKVDGLDTADAWDKMFKPLLQTKF